MKNTNTLFLAFCRTIFILCLFPTLLIACSSKDDKYNTEDYSSMTDEEIIQAQKNKAQVNQKELRDRARAAGAEVKSEEEIKAFYDEQAKKAKEYEKKAIEKLLYEEKTEERAQEAAEQLEAEQRRLRNEKLLARALKEEQTGIIQTDEPASSGVLDEAQVTKFVKEFEYAAYRDRDSSKLASLFSDEAVISVTSSSMPNAMVMNKTQFIQGTQSSWNMVKNYSYKVLSKEISIKDGVATVTGQQKEKMDMMGQSIEMITSDTMQIELQNGRLMITKVDADTGDF